MSTATIPPAMRSATGLVRPDRPVRPASARGPVARPVRQIPAPSARSGDPAAVRSCRLDVAVPAGSWRLTDRGILVVLVLAVMITVAALTVVGLTAWQVTSADRPPVAAAAWTAINAQ